MAELTATLLYFLAFLIGMMGLVVIMLDIDMLIRANWNIFSSRFFLEKEASEQYSKYIAYTTAVGLEAITISHFVSIFPDYALVDAVMRIVGTACLAMAVMLSYQLWRILSETAIPE